MTSIFCVYLFFRQYRVHSPLCPYAPKLPFPGMKGGVLCQTALWQTSTSGSSAGTLQAEGHSAKENESAIMTTKNAICFHRLFRYERILD